MNNLFFLFIFVPVLALILLGLNVLLAVHRPDESKVSAYECGFSPVYGQTRSTFQIHFYVVAMLFLIFDLEILLLFPIAVSLYQISTYGFSIAVTFVLILTAGFLLEIGAGAISLTNFYYNKPSARVLAEGNNEEIQKYDNSVQTKSMFTPTDPYLSKSNHRMSTKTPLSLINNSTIYLNLRTDKKISTLRTNTSLITTRSLSTFDFFRMTKKLYSTTTSIAMFFKKKILFYFERFVIFCYNNTVKFLNFDSFIHFILYCFVFFNLGYLFVITLKLVNIFSMFFFFIIFFSLFLFSSDNYELSEFKFLRGLQQFTFWFIFLAFGMCLFFLFTYLFNTPLFETVFCDSEEELGSIIGESEGVIEEETNKKETTGNTTEGNKDLENSSEHSDVVHIKTS